MTALLAILLTAQLVAPNTPVFPQIMSAKFSTATSTLKSGRKAEVAVSFRVIDGFKINRNPAVVLDVTAIQGVKVEKTSIKSSPIDKKSVDEYFVDLPVLKVGVTASKAGHYELPAKLTYFFCKKADGYCAKQSVDVKIPLNVE